MVLSNKRWKCGKKLQRMIKDCCHDLLGSPVVTLFVCNPVFDFILFYYFDFDFVIMSMYNCVFRGEGRGGCSVYSTEGMWRGGGCPVGRGM